MDLVEAVYLATTTLPKEEVYGLTSQMRRAVVSIPSNIAEGHGRKSPVEFVRFLNTAYGSLRELETQILIVDRLSFLSQDQAQTLPSLASEGRLVNGLTNSLRRQNRQNCLLLTAYRPLIL